MFKDLNKIILKDILMIILALLSAILLIIEVAAQLNPQEEKIIQIIDFSVALVFLSDFIYQFYRTKDKLHFFKRYWWELLAAIPITNETTQALRILNIYRIVPIIETVRLIRFAARVRMILDLSKKYTRQTYLTYVTVVVSIIVISGGVGFHYFEFGKNPEVHSLWDSLWWSLVTATTVGDNYISPVTTGGRVVALFLIFVGIGTLGIFIATIDTFIIRTQEPQ